jgi:excisionase family DNA binding protein
MQSRQPAVEPPSRVEQCYLTVADFCRMTGVGKTTAYAALRDGQISRKKLRNRTLISRDEAIAWIEGKVAAGAPVATPEAPEPPRVNQEADPSCIKCAGRVFWRLKDRGWACIRCRIPGQLKRRPDYEELTCEAEGGVQ